MTGMSGMRGAMDHANVTLEAMQALKSDNQTAKFAGQVASQKSLLETTEEITNPLGAQLKKSDKGDNEIKSRLQKLQEALGSGVIPIAGVEEKAGEFQQRNPELKKETLVNLAKMLKGNDTKDEILAKVKAFYNDVSLVDDALEFLLGVSTGKLRGEVEAAIDEFRDANKREITAGRNIAAEAREASSQGLGTPDNMRDLYRDITGNPRDAVTLFDQLSKKYDYKQLTPVVKFLHHSLGADLRSGGSSIPHGLLHRLMAETRSLQAVMGVYNHFKRLFATTGG